MTNQDLIKKAKELVRPVKLSGQTIAAEVGGALVTDKDNMYFGVSIHASCGVGFCAEHNAIGMMVTNSESKIKTIVAVGKDGKILPPCGRCREIMYQVNPANAETDVIVSENKVMKLKDLLPLWWQTELFEE